VAVGGELHAVCQPRRPSSSYQPIESGVNPCARAGFASAPIAVARGGTDMRPTIDAAERYLALLFLRRLVTFYARRRRFEQMERAARLHREITDSQNGAGHAH
jgi:hypothetical protein